MGLRGGGVVPGSERALAGGACAAGSAAGLLPLPSAGRAAPAGDGGAGLSFSAAFVFCDGTEPGRGAGRGEGMRQWGRWGRAGRP